MSNFTDVGEFHRKFDLPVVNESTTATYTDTSPGPRNVSADLLRFRIHFLKEEFEEFVEAARDRDQAGMADALVDLVYVAMGTAHVLGYPWQELWDEVQSANMQKLRATTPSQSNRHSTFDVVKPEGWEPPDVEGVLNKWGFNV